MINLPGEETNYPVGTYGQEAAKQAMSQLIQSKTVGQNIKERIALHQEAIAKLEVVYKTLETGTILDVNLNDLQQAMRW